MDGRLGRVETDVGTLRGQAAEALYRDRAGAYFARLLSRVRALSRREVDELLDRALDSDLLHDAAAREIRLADLIVRGRRPEDGQEAYLVVEVSVGIGLDDVERAAQRAVLLSKLGETLPVVAGERITPEAEALAMQYGVQRVLDGRVVDPAGESST
jgi:hypothetical protein